MIDWGGKVAAWFAGVAGVSIALATLIATTAKQPFHGSTRAVFIILVVIAGVSFIMLLLTGLPAAWAAWRNRGTRQERRPDTWTHAPSSPPPPDGVELKAIKDVLSYWESDTRLRNLTASSDPVIEGLADSVKRWRAKCQDAIKVLQHGAQRDMVREAQKAAIPVESLLNRIQSGSDGSSAYELDKALEEMQKKIEVQMQPLAKSVGLSLEPREPE